VLVGLIPVLMLSRTIGRREAGSA
ncbi:MAG: hypothetical protein RL087_431, partial [Pseudomonadota bacterium]